MIEIHSASGRAAVFTKALGPLTIQDFPLPKVEPNSTLVRVKIATICGSDLHRWRGERPTSVPAILGHESMGIVHETGVGVTVDFAGAPLAQGDRVVYSYFYPCGRCPSCLRNDPTMCTRRTALNGSMTCDKPPHFNGSFAEYLYLRPQNPVFRVPDDLSDELVAPINCALSTIIFALDRTSVKLGDTVVVQGAGALGIYATAVAKEMGASKVVVIDPVEERLKMAERFGADETINPLEYGADEDKIGRVRQVTGNQGADMVVEVAGVPQVVPEGLRMLRKGGSYVEVGCVGENSMASIDVSTISLSGLKVIGTLNYEPWCLPRAFEFLRNTMDRYPYEQIMTHPFSLNEINEALESADKRKATRVALRP